MFIGLSLFVVYTFTLHKNKSHNNKCYFKKATWIKKKQLIYQLFNDYNQTVMQFVLFIDEGPLSVYFVLLRTNPTYTMNMKTAKMRRLIIATRMFCENGEYTCSLVSSSWQLPSPGLEFEVGASFVINSTSLRKL